MPFTLWNLVAQEYQSPQPGGATRLTADIAPRALTHGNHAPMRLQVIYFTGIAGVCML